MNIRQITIDDKENCGRIIYEAFYGIADRHNFQCDFSTPESALQMAEMCIESPLICGFAAEDSDGKFLGSNFLWEHDAIRAVGPITVDPAAQSRGTGRRLMEAVIERGAGAPGIRLVQEAVNAASMSLYASLGFEVKEPLILISGKPRGSVSENVSVRPMTEADVEECGTLCEKVHGFARTGEILDALKFFKPFVAERDGKIIAYATTVSMWHLNHGVAETERDMYDLLTGASQQIAEPVEFLLPTRQAKFHQWALASGFRMIKPTTLMTMGEYYEPNGCYFPSVLY